jgi:hypothetical protein
VRADAPEGGESRVAHVSGKERVRHEMLPSIAQVLLSDGINSKIETCGTTGPPRLRPSDPVEQEANSELGTRGGMREFYSLSTVPEWLLLYVPSA